MEYHPEQLFEFHFPKVGPFSSIMSAVFPILPKDPRTGSGSSEVQFCIDASVKQRSADGTLPAGYAFLPPTASFV